MEPELVRERNRGGEVAQPDMPVGVELPELPQHTEDALAGAAIVFGRLAGFLSAQLPPDADVFRMVTGAVVDGYAEPGKLS